MQSPEPAKSTFARALGAATIVTAFVPFAYSVYFAWTAFVFRLELEIREGTLWIEALAKKAGADIYDSTCLAFVNMDHVHGDLSWPRRSLSLSTTAVRHGRPSRPRDVEPHREPRAARASSTRATRWSCPGRIASSRRAEAIPPCSSATRLEPRHGAQDHGIAALRRARRARRGKSCASRLAGVTNRCPMQWKKAPPELLATFEKAVPKAAHVDTRKMFGYPACFACGNMFMGLYQDSFIVRLGEADRAALLALPNARRFEPMPGRPMKEYVVVPPAMLSGGPELAAWVAKALEYGLSLPAKGAKKPSARNKLIVPRKSAPAKPAGTKGGDAHAKTRPRTTAAPPRPRRQSGTVKKAAPGRSR